jgi:hypothetical protein
MTEDQIDDQAKLDTFQAFILYSGIRHCIEGRWRALIEEHDRDAEVWTLILNEWERLAVLLYNDIENWRDATTVNNWLKLNKYISPRDIPTEERARELATDKSPIADMLWNVAGLNHFKITEAVDGAAGGERQGGRSVEAVSAIRALTLYLEGKRAGRKICELDSEIAAKLCTQANGHLHENCIEQFRAQRRNLSKLLNLTRK